MHVVLRWVWPLMVVALLGAVWLPVGVKSVHLADCRGDWRDYRCDHTHWDADYELFRLGTFKREYSSGDSDPYPAGGIGTPWAYKYTDDDAPHADQITFLLPVAGLFLPVVGAMAIAAGYVHAARPGATTRLIAIIAWGAVALTMLMFLAGMAWHAFTWRGADVDPLRPGLGMACFATALLSGVPLLPQKERDVLPALPGIDIAPTE